MASTEGLRKRRVDSALDKIDDKVDGELPAIAVKHGGYMQALRMILFVFYFTSGCAW